MLMNKEEVESIPIDDARRKLNKILDDKKIKCPICKSDDPTEFGISRFEGQMVGQQIVPHDGDPYLSPEDRIFVRFTCRKCETVFDKHIASQFYIDNLDIFLARFDKDLLVVFLRGFMFCNKIASIIDLLRLNGLFESELHLEDNHYISHRRNNFYLLCNIISEIYEFVAGDYAPLGALCGIINKHPELNYIKEEECFKRLQSWQNFNNWRKAGKWNKDGKDYYAFIRNVISWHNSPGAVENNKFTEVLNKIIEDDTVENKEFIVGVHSGLSNNNFDRTFIGYLLELSSADYLKEFDELVKSSRKAIEELPYNFEALFQKICDTKSGASKLLAHREYIDVSVVKAGHLNNTNKV